MKKYIIPVFATLALLASCTSKFDEMNTSSTGLTDDSVQAQYVFGRCLYHGMSNDHQRNFNLNDDMYAHYFAEGLGWTDYWYYNEGWGNIYWRDFYTERQREFLLVDQICGDNADYAGMKAANDIWNVLLWLRVIDRYGDAPYKDAEGNYAGNGVTIAYNSISEIYPDLIKRLQADAAALANPGALNFGSYDLLYANDWTKWRKLANTLVMRLSMRLAGTTLAGDAKTAFVAAVNGAMDSPEDYARISCDSSIWGDYYDRTYYDWANTFTNADFMDMMNGTNKGYATGVVDPRRGIWFSEGTGAKAGYSNWDGFPVKLEIDTRNDEKEAHGGAGSYAGLNDETAEGFFFFDHHGSANQNLSWCLATYSETLFLQAEAVLRNWISGDAQAFFKQGIKASMDEVCWFIQRSGGKTTISAAEQDAYIAALPAFGVDKEDKLRSIIIQKWIAMYPNSPEAWNDQRRTGYPDYASGVLTYPTIHSSSLVKEGNIVQRIPYPDNEYNTNADNMPANYKGGTRDQQSNLFWALGGEGATQSYNIAPNNKLDD